MDISYWYTVAIKLPTVKQKVIFHFWSKKCIFYKNQELYLFVTIGGRLFNGGFL